VALALLQFAIGMAREAANAQLNLRASAPICIDLRLILVFVELARTCAVSPHEKQDFNADEDR
jgi:hypothetical protein